MFPSTLVPMGLRRVIVQGRLDAVVNSVFARKANSIVDEGWAEGYGTEIHEKISQKGSRQAKKTKIRTTSYFLRFVRSALGA